MIRHVASIAEIVEDVEATVTFYRDVLGLEVEHETGNEYAVVKVAGTLHFGIWSRRMAAESVYGNRGEALRIPLGFSVGFEVDEVAQAEAAIINRGWNIVQPMQKEPWEQVTARFLTPSGALAEIAETPWGRTIEGSPSHP